MSPIPDPTPESAPLEEYALIGDTHTAGLVHRRGAIEWLCLPRFDSRACFASLLGTAEHGFWSVGPLGEGWSSHREYVEDTLVLRTTHSGPDGVVRVTDCMPVRADTPTVVRRVEGVRGRVRMRSRFVPRFDYGSVVPWSRSRPGRVDAVAGPDRLTLVADVDHRLDRDAATADFSVAAGEVVRTRLSWSRPEVGDDPGITRAVLDDRALDDTTRWWREWTAHGGYEGRYREAVTRSLITLKALTYAPTGGMVAAPTMSLPERLGGDLNWDYRYCWIRDATFTLLALLEAGYREAARDWREWLLRAVAGRPEQMQILYGIDGTRRLPETEFDWLPGYANSRPVRAGNRAAQQFQLDVYGELMDVLHQARAHGIPPRDDAWSLQRGMMDFLEGNWREPDNGVWEVRGEREQFTHSKVMAWAAADRAVAAVERFGLDGPADRWRRLRRTIFDDVCEKGYDPHGNTFTQCYGSPGVDAALLLIPSVGFLPATDERVRGTVAAVERELLDRSGLVHRYRSPVGAEPLPAAAGRSPHGEGAFLVCTFWLADNYLLRGDVDRGLATFERLLALRNDVGLLSEEYDSGRGRQVGNFPQALSHLALVGTAFDLGSARVPAHRRTHESPAARRG